MNLESGFGDETNVTYTFRKKAEEPPPLPHEAVTNVLSKKEQQVPVVAEVAQSVEIRVGQEFTDQHGVKFRILEKLGEGGMGGVYKVTDERTGLTRAIKFVKADIRGQESTVARFRREIYFVGLVNSSYVLKAEDAGTYTVGGEEMAGLVTEVVDSSLDRELKFDRKLKPDRIAVLMGQLLLGLEDLRKAGVVHRDIKPENIYLQKLSDGQTLLKIGDFGMAKRSSDAPELSEAQTAKLIHEGIGKPIENVTEGGLLGGTPVYMAPEYAKGQPPNHRNDLYSAGILMCKLVTEHTPFEKTKDLNDLFRAKQNDDPPTFEQLGVENVPDWLKKIAFKLLESDPNKRYQTAGEAFQELNTAVAKQYPELKYKIPFEYFTNEQTYGDAQQSRAA